MSSRFHNNTVLVNLPKDTDADDSDDDPLAYELPVFVRVTFGVNVPSKRGGADEFKVHSKTKSTNYEEVAGSPIKLRVGARDTIVITSANVHADAEVTLKLFMLLTPQQASMWLV